MVAMHQFCRVGGLIGAVAAIGVLTACAYANHRRFHTRPATVVVQPAPVSAAEPRIPSEMPEPTAEADGQATYSEPYNPDELEFVDGSSETTPDPSWKDGRSPFAELDARRQADAEAAAAAAGPETIPPAEVAPSKPHADVFAPDAVGTPAVPGSIRESSADDPAARPATAPSSAGAAGFEFALPVLTKQDVIDMARSGVGDEIIREMVKASHLKMTLNSQLVIELHQAGLAPETVLAIVRRITAQEEREGNTSNSPPGPANAVPTAPRHPNNSPASEPVNSR